MHKSVLLNEVIGAFKDQPRKPELLVEGTFGRGGHTKVLMETFPNLKIIAFDLDKSAIDVGQGIPNLTLIHDDFKNFENHGIGNIDGALLDLGVSSPQFDDGQRGFSFNLDGPLDMRMNQDQELKASDIVNNWSEKDLNDLFHNLGEVHSPFRVVRAIVHDRKENPFLTTRSLASLIERVDGRHGKIHPATRHFMALRLAVNSELEGLDDCLRKFVAHLNDGTRIVVISFHSLEDRIVKNVFKSLHRKSGEIINKKVITASEAELTENPRSRSAKLRIFQKGVTQ